MNDHIRAAAIVLGGTLLAAAPAKAAPVLRTYQAVARFASGPLPIVTSVFTLLYDPSVSGAATAVTDYSSSVPDASFNPALVQFGNTTVSSFPTNVFVGGSDAGPATVVAGTADFQINFFADRVTGSVPAGAMLVPYSAAASYSVAGGSTIFSTFDVTISTVAATGSAVPEETTWALMVAGIGMAGAALRRRRVVTTRVAFA